MLGGLVGPDMVKGYIERTLENVAEEYNVGYKDIFITIRPSDEDFNFKLYVCSYDEKGNPKPLRVITLEEVLKS